MKIGFFILITASLLSWAHSKSGTSTRKPADSHGGVMVSNAQFEAASAYALNEGGTLNRVFSVQKRIDCASKDGSIFEVKYGSQNSETGKESFDSAAHFLIVSFPRSGDMPEAKNLSVKSYEVGNCKSRK